MGFYQLFAEANLTHNDDVLGQLGCVVCPLNKINHNSKMSPDGRPGGIYVLGSSPDIDSQGIPFTGRRGEAIKSILRHQGSVSAIRYNNVIRSSPQANRDPSSTEISCCRNSIVKDIEESLPIGIIGIGKHALNFASGLINIDVFRGRRLPVFIGNHRCWFYPVQSSSVLFGKNQASGDFLRRDIAAAVKDIEMSPELPEQFNISNFDNNYSEFTEISAQLWVRLKEIFRADVVSFDIETHSPNGLRDPFRPYGEGNEVLSISFASCNGVVAFPISHSGNGNCFADEAKWIVFDIFMQGSAKSFVAHGLEFDLEWLLEIIIPRESIAEFLKANRHKFKCTIAQAYVLDNRKGAMKLNTLCLQYFGVNMKELEKVDVGNLKQTPLKTVLRYNGLDAYFTEKLFAVQNSRIEKSYMQAVVAEQYRRIPTLVQVSRIGLLIDQDESEKQRKDVLKSLKKVEETIEEMDIVKKWEAVNLTKFEIKPKQIADVFTKYTDVKLPETEKGNQSTRAEAMLKIEHPLASNIIKRRELSTLHDTFISTIAPGGKHLWADGRLHPRFNSCRTNTRRLSSSSPNGQNFPSRKGKEIRNQIIAPNGYVIVSLDFGQIEARVIAADSQDPKFVEYILSGEDIHDDWGKRIFKKYPQWKRTDRRFAAKNGLVFAAFYLASSPTIGGHLQVPIPIAEALLRDFWVEFSGIKNWQNKLIEEYHRKGFLELCTGFRCRGIFTEYQIVNFRVQGSASDIVVAAMNRLSEKGIQACLNIHDDLMFYLPEQDLDEQILNISEEMKKPPEFMRQIPLEVEVSIGKAWGSLEPYSAKQKH